jgi:hypothetical protein
LPIGITESMGYNLSKERENYKLKRKLNKKRATYHSSSLLDKMPADEHHPSTPSSKTSRTHQ